MSFLSLSDTAARVLWFVIGVKTVDGTIAASNLLFRERERAEVLVSSIIY